MEPRTARKRKRVVSEPILENPQPWKVGQEVEGLWEADRQWYRCTVKGYTSDGLVKVQFNDEKKVRRELEFADVREVGSSINGESQSSNVKEKKKPSKGRGRSGAELDVAVDIVPGSRVMCNWKLGGIFYPAIVSQYNPEDNTFNLIYEDGDKELRIPPTRMRKDPTKQQLVIAQASSIEKVVTNSQADVEFKVGDIVNVFDNNVHVGSATIFKTHPAAIHCVDLNENEVAISDFKLINASYATKTCDVDLCRSPLFTYGEAHSYYVKVGKSCLRHHKGISQTLSLPSSSLLSQHTPLQNITTVTRVNSSVEHNVSNDKAKEPSAALEPSEASESISLPLANNNTAKTPPTITSKTWCEEIQTDPCIQNLDSAGSWIECKCCFEKEQQVTIPGSSKVKVVRPYKRLKCKRPFDSWCWKDHISSKSHRENSTQIKSKCNTINNFCITAPSLNMGPSEKFNVVIRNRRRCYGLLGDGPMSKLIQLFYDYCYDHVKHGMFTFSLKVVDNKPLWCINAPGCPDTAADSTKNRSLRTDNILACTTCYEAAREKGIGHNLMRRIRETVTTVKKVLHLLDNATSYSEADILELRNFIKGSNHTEKRKELTERVKRFLSYIEVYKMNNAAFSGISTNQVPNPVAASIAGDVEIKSPNAFIKDFAELILNSPEVEDSMIMVMLKAFIAKANGKRLEYDPRYFALCEVLRLISPKAYDIFRENFDCAAPAPRHIQATVARDRDFKNCILNVDEDAIKVRSESLVNNVATQRGETSTERSSVFATLGFDATKASEEIALHDGYKHFFGGSWPNHCIPMHHMSEVSSANQIIKANEVEIALLNIQNCPPGILASSPIAGLPQTTNACNTEFINTVVSAVESSGVTLLGIAFDGVSTKADMVSETMMKFFHGDINHVALVDCKHLCKAYRNAILGPNILSIGDFIIDKGVFTTANVPSPAVRVTNFASDKLVETLFSPKTMKDVKEAMITEDEKHTFVTCMSLFFGRSLLLACDCDTLSNEEKVVLLFNAMHWITSLKGLSMITKRNIVKGVIGSVCLLLQKATEKYRLTQTEANEHFYGILRYLMSTFNCVDLIQLCDKAIRILDLTVNFNLKDRKGEKGYQSGRLDFIEKTLGSAGSGYTGTVDCDYSKNVFQQITAKLLYLYNYSVTAMKKIFSSLGIAQSSISPFTRELLSGTDLAKLYYFYMEDDFRAKSSYTMDPLPFDMFGGDFSTEMAYSGVNATVINEHVNEDDEDSNAPTSNAKVSKKKSEVLAKAAKEFSEYIEGKQHQLDITVTDNDTETLAKDFVEKETLNLCPEIENESFLANTSGSKLHEWDHLVRGCTYDFIDNVLETSIKCIADLSLYKKDYSRVNGKKGTKSLLDRWMSTVDMDDTRINVMDENGNLILRRDVLLKGSDDNNSYYRIKCVLTKSYNKWRPIESCLVTDKSYIVHATLIHLHGISKTYFSESNGNHGLAPNIKLTNIDPSSLVGLVIHQNKY